MKIIITVLCSIISSALFSQAQLDPGTKANDALKSVKDGYTTNLGWEIKTGDTIKIGVGNRERQSFSYIYSSPDSFLQVMDADGNGIKYLGNDYNGIIGLVKKFGVKGNKKIGYKAYLVVGLGELENYWVEIEDAVRFDEVVPKNPMHRYQKEIPKVKVAGQEPDKYDQLAKLKKLFDQGVLTEKEYKDEKEKILKIE